MAAAIPRNQAGFRLDEVVKATGARLLRGGCAGVSGVCTDSRGDLSGQLFVALRGERFDGHDYLLAAAEGGATALLVEREVSVPEGVAVLVVADCLVALGDLARYHRARHRAKVVAIAGSAGKTTTKSCVAAVLDSIAPGRVHRTPGNLNNLVGVPMVLLALDAQHEYAVVELGTNQPGEVRRLTEVAEPDVGVLTLIDLEHTEGLIDLDGVEREEGDLLPGIRATGAIVYNADDARVARQVDERGPALRIGYGELEHAGYRLVARRCSATGVSDLEVRRPDGSSVELRTSLLGAAGAHAALAALAVSEHLTGVSVAGSKLNDALSSSDLNEAGRLHPVELADGTLVIDDSYNSNPASVLSSLGVARELAAARSARLVLVLGEMRELGALSRDQHLRIGRELRSIGASVLIAVAGDARHFVATDGVATDGARQTECYVPDAAAALGPLLDAVTPGDVILVKASRGVGVERVVSGLVDAKGRAA